MFKRGAKNMPRQHYDVSVTSPKFKWLGNAVEQDEPPVLSVLVGKALSAGDQILDTGQDATDWVAQDSAARDIVALFFEKEGDSWRIVPVNLIGTNPYTVNGMLAGNYLNLIRQCANAAEQISYVKDIGLTIDGEIVRC